MGQQWQIIKPDNAIDKLLYEFTSILRSGYIEIGEEKTVMPLCYADYAKDIENFEVRDSDIYVMSHPKTGTTWLQELVWMTYNLDYEKGKVELKERFPFLEFVGIQEVNSKKFIEKCPNYPRAGFMCDTVNYTKELKDNPRFIKTHLPWSLLPKDIRENIKKPKIIYIARNPKDTCVSFYHHCRLMEGYTRNFDDFCKLFLAGRLHYAPFWKHINGFWARKDQPNILFLYFEDLKKDLKSEVLKVARFLEKELTEDDLLKLVDHLSFESMKKNKSLNNEVAGEILKKIFNNGAENESFFRSGKVGGFAAEIKPETIKIFDAWTEQHTKESGITFSDKIIL